MSPLCNNHGKSNNPYPSIPSHCQLTRAGPGPSSRNLGKGRVDIIWSCPLPTKSTITQPTEKKANISYIFHTMNFLCVTHNQWDSLETPTLIPFSLTISVNFSLAYISHHFSIRGRESSLCRTQPLMTLWHVSGRRRGWSHGWHHGHLWWTQVR